MTTLKSIGANMAGVLFIIIVTTLVDLAPHAVHFFPAMDRPINDQQGRAATRAPRGT